MTYKKLTTGETTQCYKNALNELNLKDRLIMTANMKALEDNIPNERYHPISDYSKMEILSKLGIWLNKEHPVKEDD